MSVQRKSKEQVIKNFALSAKDTGSMEVQIALLSQHIDQIKEHLAVHKKDTSSKRGLLKLLARRRGYLGYVEEKDKTRYKNIIERLSLRK